MQQEVVALGAIVLSITAVATLFASFFTVNQGTTAIVQRFGSFLREAGAGLHFRVPFADRVAGRINLRVQQLETVVHAKTMDSTFVHIGVAVQYRVSPKKVCDAFYGLDDARRQMTSAVSDIVMEQVTRIGLEDLFRNCEGISKVVTDELSQLTEPFGYRVLGALVTDIDPDPQVEASMNALNAAKRMRAAATERGEAERIQRVAVAEGDAEGKILLGRSTADERRIVIAGLRDSVDDFRRAVPGTTVKDVMNLVLMTQYFEMLKEMKATSETNAILAPNSPGSLTSLAERMLNAIVASDQAVGMPEKKSESPSELRSASEKSLMPLGPKLPAPNPPENGGQTHPETSWK